MNEDRVDILLVDDEHANLDALEAVLEDQSYRLLRATNADTALKLLLEHDVAAIVLDIKMPGISGFELAKMIKGTKRFRQIPIVFLTAYLVDDRDIMTGYGTGAVDYLTKPFNPAILRQKIAVFAELFSKTRALAELNDTLESRVKERTAELERSEAALRASNRQKDEFLATLAHELRNPLAPLRMGIDLLMQRLADEAHPSVANTLTRMDRQMHHIVRLIDDLMDVARISRGVLELKRERTELTTVVSAAIDAQRLLIERRKHMLAVEMPQKVWAHADSTRIVQIVGNLLHNAAKFTPDGGSIRIVLAEERGKAVVRVSDSGVGIPPEQIERVFAMFASVDRGSSPADRGLGIGLALARRLAELHGGMLSAKSEGANLGTTFTLELPALEAPREVAAPAPARRERVAEALHIVVIEDNRDTADSLSEWLSDMGHEVWVARSGPSGVELVQQKAPDLVLCDIGLPELDGIEVCRRVREMQIAQPIMVALTGWGRDEDRRGTAAAGFDAHLVKPVAPDKLREILQSFAS